MSTTVRIGGAGADPAADRRRRRRRPAGAAPAGAAGGRGAAPAGAAARAEQAGEATAPAGGAAVPPSWTTPAIGARRVSASTVDFARSYACWAWSRWAAASALIA